MTALTKVRSGEPFRAYAKDHNVMVDMARDYLGGSLRIESSAAGGRFASSIVQIKNGSGADRVRFDVLALDDVFPDPTEDANGFAAGPIFHGITPTADYYGRFAILLEPAASDAVAAACVGGLCVGRVDADAAVAHIYHADLKPGDAGSLKITAGGSARVLWRETGTGVKNAVLLLGAAPAIMRPACNFSLAAALTTSAASVSGTITKQIGWGIDHATTSITLYNHQTHASGTYMFSGDSSDTGKAEYDPVEDKWWIKQMECP